MMVSKFGISFSRDFFSGSMLNFGVTYFWLVVSTPLKNMSQIGSFPQVGVKIKNIWNHHLGLVHTLPLEGSGDSIVQLQCVHKLEWSTWSLQQKKSLLVGSSQWMAQWLIIMVIVSPLRTKWPIWLINGGDPNYLLSGMILQVLIGSESL